MKVLNLWLMFFYSTISFASFISATVLDNYQWTKYPVINMNWKLHYQSEEYSLFASPCLNPIDGTFLGFCAMSNTGKGGGAVLSYVHYQRPALF